jgi:ADP-ribose pyrophosphatase YjhB (NUDIX family)
MTPAEQIALWADKLRDVSALGLHFAQNIYDKEHYQTVQDIAMAMLALATGESVAALEPLRAPIFTRPTPLCVGDAAVIDDAGRILLIQRADNKLWAMPGGALEVGETPAEGVAREALEETGVTCHAVALVGVFDSRFYGNSRHHLYQFVFLCKPFADVEMVVASHAHETVDKRWFAEDELPTALDPNHAERIPIAFRVWRGESAAFFDTQGLTAGKPE